MTLNYKFILYVNLKYKNIEGQKYEKISTLKSKSKILFLIRLF